MLLFLSTSLIVFFSIVLILVSYSKYLYENTLKALNKAIEDKEYMTEIDVQQIKDETLIVMHGTNFKGVAGVDKNIWDTEYKEVQTFDAGKYFSNQTEKELFLTLE